MVGPRTRDACTADAPFARAVTIGFTGKPDAVLTCVAAHIAIVHVAVVAGFAEFMLSVSAHGSRRAHAAEAQEPRPAIGRDVARRALPLLAQPALALVPYDAILIQAKEAHIAARISIVPVTVVAHLSLIGDAVAAGCSGTDIVGAKPGGTSTVIHALQEALRAAAVAALRVPVITGFGGFLHAVAADRLAHSFLAATGITLVSADAFDLALQGTAISIHEIAVVTRFTYFLNSIATDRLAHSLLANAGVTLVAAVAFDLALYGAAIIVREVAIITRFTDFFDPVTAAGNETLTGTTIALLPIGTWVLCIATARAVLAQIGLALVTVPAHNDFTSGIAGGAAPGASVAFFRRLHDAIPTTRTWPQATGAAGVASAR